MSGIKHVVNYGDGHDWKTGERFKVEIEQSCFNCQRFNGDRCEVLSDYWKFSNFNDCRQWVLDARKARTD